MQRDFRGQIRVGPESHGRGGLSERKKEYEYKWSYVDLRTSRWPNDQVYHATYHPLFL